MLHDILCYGHTYKNNGKCYSFDIQNVSDCAKYSIKMGWVQRLNHSATDVQQNQNAHIVSGRISEPNSIERGKL